MMEIQQFDLETRHIKEVQNHPADVSSRSPRGLNGEETRNLTRPDQIMVHKIQVYEDKTLRKKLQALATQQDVDETLTTLRGKVTSHPITHKDQYRIQENVWYCREGKDRHKWKAMLPNNLEQKIFKYVHLSLGHLGVDKCLEEIKCVFHVKDL
jgi:hypothetical protein